MEPDPMLSEILAAVERSLPATGASVLRTALNKAEADAKELASARAVVKRLEEELKAVEAKVRQMSERDSAVTKRETDVAVRERTVADVEMKLLKAELLSTHAKERADEMRSILTTVFQGPVFRRVVSQNNQVPNPNPNGYTSTMTETRSTSEEVTG